MSADLYRMPIDPNAWVVRCGGNTGDAGTDESCAETAELPGGGIAIRDNKRPDLGEQRYTAVERARLKDAL